MDGGGSVAAETEIETEIETVAKAGSEEAAAGQVHRWKKRGGCYCGRRTSHGRRGAWS